MECRSSYSTRAALIGPRPYGYSSPQGEDKAKMLARSTRESLVAALAVKHLDRTLTTALPSDQYDETAVGATGLTDWDGPLGGGFPRGHVSEIVGPNSSGRTSVLLQMLAAATARGELVAVVDALDRLDPESAAAAGVDLSRLLWVRGRVVTTRVLSTDPASRALEQAIKALTLILQAGNFGLVVFDAGDAPADVLARLPFTTWMRLQRIVEGQPTICLLLGREPMARSAAGLTLKLSPRHQGVARPQIAAGLFRGLEAEARIVRARARGREDRVWTCRTSAVAHG